MDNHAKCMRLLTMVVIMLSVTANLLRPAPLEALDGAEPSSVAYAAAPVFVETALHSPLQTSDCPYPTEIENADCDNGLCKTVVVSGAACPAAPCLASRKLGPARDHKGLARKPELTPPKLFA